MREHYAETIEEMFAAVSDLYARYWGEHFHFAVFENDAEPWQAALERTHAQYLEALRIGEARTALDLACGRGGFADLLARDTGGEVLGVDLSRAQLAAARRFRRRNLTFRHFDVMHIDELGKTFDAVSFLDAACYLPDKPLAMRKIARVLSPGGRFLLVEWCRREGLHAVQEELVLHPFMRAWGISNLGTIPEYRRWLERAGLRVVEMRDLNDRVRPNWEIGYANGIRAITEPNPAQAARILWKGVRRGSRGLELIKAQFTAALYVKAGFDAGFLRYTYWLMEKPAR